MSRLLPLLLAAALAAALAVPAAGLAAPWDAFIQADTFAPGSAWGRLRGRSDTYCSYLNASGTGCALGRTNFYSFGGRGGLTYTVDGTRFGLSAGAMSGGPNRDRLLAETTAAGRQGLVHINTYSAYYRALAEAARAVHFQSGWSAWLAVGAGIGVARETTTCTAAGSLQANCAGIEGRVTAGWATWEVTPSVRYDQWELGVRYMGNARGDQPPWNTYGLTVGMRYP